MSVQQATLHSYGRLPWNVLRAALDGVAVAWADYEGFHIGAAPDTAPPYAHMWGWTTDWLLRARIDGGDTIAGALEIGASASSGLRPLSTEQVSYILRRSHTWPSSEHRVGRLAPEVADRPVDLYEVGGEFPITFVSLDVK